MSSYRLAQINFARLRTPLSDPKMARFVRFLRSVNSLADASPGFVSRLDEQTAMASGDRLFPQQTPGTTLVNLSVWKSVGALQRYTSLGQSGGVMTARQSWFKRFDGHWMALWWVPEDGFPDVADGWKRVQHLRRFRDTPYSFTFSKPFPPPPGGQDYQPLPPETDPSSVIFPIHVRPPEKRSFLPKFLDW